MTEFQKKMAAILVSKYGATPAPSRSTKYVVLTRTAREPGKAATFWFIGPRSLRLGAKLATSIPASPYWVKQQLEAAAAPRGKAIWTPS